MSFILLVSCILLFGPLLSFIIYFIHKPKSFLCSKINFPSTIYGKFNDLEVSIDKIIKDFRLLNNLN